MMGYGKKAVGNAVAFEDEDEELRRDLIERGNVSTNGHGGRDNHGSRGGGGGAKSSGHQQLNVPRYLLKAKFSPYFVGTKFSSPSLWQLRYIQSIFDCLAESCCGCVR
jgi:hypothetical protein